MSNAVAEKNKAHKSRRGTRHRVEHALGYAALFFLADGYFALLLAIGAFAALAGGPEGLAGSVWAGSILVGFQWPLCRSAGGYGCWVAFAAGGGSRGRVAVAGVAVGPAFDGESVMGAIRGVAGIERLS